MLEKYVFDRSFDEVSDIKLASSPSATPLEAHAEEALSHTQVKSYEEGFQEGFQKGRESHVHERETQTLSILKGLQEHLLRFIDQQEKGRLEAVELAGQMVRSVIEKIFPSLENNAELAAFDLKKKLLPLLKSLSEKSVTIIINPTMLPFIEARIREWHKGTFDIQLDAGVANGDCRVLWDQSGVEVLKKSVLDEILVLLSDLKVMARNVLEAS